MKNWFSVKLYLEGLKKIKTAGIAAAITVIALNAIIPIIAIFESNASWPGQIRYKTVVPVSGFAAFNLLMMVFGAIFVYSMFSYMNERNKSDFWHAIPQKRVCVYFSLLAAIWTWILGIILASSIVNLILWAIAKYYIVRVSTVFVSAAVYFLVAVMIAAFMMLAMSVTGTTVSNLLITVLFMLFVRVIGAIFVMCLDNLVPMFDINYSIWRILEIEFCLPFALLGNIFSNKVGPFGDITLLIYSVVVTIFLVALGAIGYTVRKSETATKSAPNTLMQHIYRCAVTFPLVFLMGALIISEDSEFSTNIILVIVTVIVWALFELVTTKKFKNVIKSLPVLVVPVIASVLLCFMALLMRNTVWNDLPSADEIEGISIATSSYRTKTYEQIQIDDIVVENEELKHLVSDSLRDTVAQSKKLGYVPNSRHIVIHLKSGRTMGRNIALDDKSYSAVRDGFYQSSEYRTARLSLPDSGQIDDISFSRIDIGKAENKRLWASFLYEYNLLSDVQKRIVKEYYDYDTGYYDKQLDASFAGATYSQVGYVTVNGMVGMERFQSQYPIFYEYMPKTAQLYLEGYSEVSGILAQGARKEIAALCEMADTIKENPEEIVYGNLSFETLFGNMGLTAIDVSVYSDKKDNLPFLAEVLSQLNSLSNPEDYEYNKGKTIVYCYINMEVSEAYFNGEIAQEVYKDRYYHYYNALIPLALTDAEISRIIEIYEKNAVEKVPAR